MYRIICRGVEIQCDLIDEVLGLYDRLGVPWDTAEPRKTGRPPGRTQSSPDRDAQIVRMSSTGVSHQALASQYGLSIARVDQIIRRAESIPLLIEEQEQGA